MENSLNLTGLINVIDNKTGEIIRSTHNMVVNTGRDLILKKLVGNSDAADSTINAIFVSNTMDETTFSRNKILTTDTSSSGAYYVIDFNDTNTPITNTNEYSGELNLIKPYKSIEIRITQELFNILKTAGVQTISSIGLLVDYKLSNQNNTILESCKLFSRATFDPILLNEDSDFTITYYLYI